MGLLFYVLLNSIVIIGIFCFPLAIEIKILLNLKNDFGNYANCYRMCIDIIKYNGMDRINTDMLKLL